VFELLAQGPEPNQRLRHVLTPDTAVTLGRGADVPCCISWDRQISTRHAEFTLRDGLLHVRLLPESTNPLYFQGKSEEACEVLPGRHFVLGQTAFRLLRVEGDSTSGGERPVQEVAFTQQQLQQIRYQDPENRLEVLTHLPEVIAGARDDQELRHRLVNLLLKGVVHAEAAAIVSVASGEVVRVWHWERRRETAGELRPSRRLTWEALSHRRGTVLHVWEPTIDANAGDNTLGQEFDWAYCTPVTGLAAEQTGLYVAGKMGPTFVPGTTLSDKLLLNADVKFTELVAEIIGAVLKARRMERQKAGLRQFFAPPILAALGDELDTTLLEPCECDVTVMFCDLRGFSQRAESSAGDLIGLLERVSRALGVMTQHILEHGGVTGDFQGDAALGFWGWPFASPEAAVNACRAALGIRSAFARAAAQKNHPLSDFAMGIGIAHGRAVAGKIGTSEQVKVTVFGPVVNLASRLESMTKQLHVPILVDESTRHILQERLLPEEGRLRTLGKVLPYGMDTPVLVSELLPPFGEGSELTAAHVEQYEAGVAAFLEGRWDEAYRHLHQMPASDRAQDFLLQQITARNRLPPVDWDGIVRLPGK
jgi:adenylate cyclase